MEEKLINYELDDLNERLKKLEAEEKEKEKSYEIAERNERFEQTGIEEDYNDEEPKQSDLEKAEDELYDVRLSIKKTEDIISKIEQCNEAKANYSNGFKRTIREQTSKSVEDRLNRKEKASKVAEIVEDKRVKTVGVFGEWGTGKSTFLEYIQDKLPTKKTKIINIKATEYSDQEGIWAYFFSKMKESVKKDLGLRFIYFLLRVLKNWKKCIIPIIYIGVTIALIVVIFKWNLIYDYSVLLGMDEDKAIKLNTGMNYFITAVFVIKFILPFAGEIIDSVKTSVNSFPTTKRDVKEKLGYKLVVKEYIKELTRIWKKHRFIFCVDELDRCNNAAIMSFLEAIQLLEDYPSIQIIYTIDSQVILNAISDAGVYNPHNYLKKYVDLKVDLESINDQTDSIETIAKEFGFEDKEIEKIHLAMDEMEINISMRDFLQILNALSELKERWFDEEVRTEMCKIPDKSEDALNWYNTIPISLLYFAGSMWPRKIYNDFKRFKRAYIKVYHIAQNAEIERQYYDCPAFLKQAELIDVTNAFRYLNTMQPIYKEIDKESSGDSEKDSNNGGRS